MAMLDWGPLEQACMSCQKCALADTRHNVVFGAGVPNAEVMFIGEGPGENEDLQGEPFVGRGGKLLDDMLELIDAIRLIKEDFKISKEHGQWFEKAGIHMTALFHPAAILRDPRRRPETFEDLKGLQAKIQAICERTY